MEHCIHLNIEDKTTARFMALVTKAMAVHTSKDDWQQ